MIIVLKKGTARETVNQLKEEIEAGAYRRCLSAEGERIAIGITNNDLSKEDELEIIIAGFSPFSERKIPLSWLKVN